MSVDLEIKAGIRDPNMLQYFKETEFRTTQYLRGFIIQLTDNYTKQIGGRYKEVKAEQARLIRENLETVWIDSGSVPKKDKGETRQETKTLESHYAATVVHAVQRSGKEINKDINVIQIIPNRRGFKQSPPEVFILNRYGPWHMDTLPFVPKDNQATILFKEVSKEKALDVKKKNKQSRFKILTSLRKLNVNVMPREEVDEKLKGYDDLEWWALRTEFGIDTRTKRVWKPALKWVTSEGVKKLITRDIKLNKTLYDPNFKDYKNIDKGYRILGEDVAEDLTDFQDKIRG